VQRLWSTWRSTYVSTESSEGCFICDAVNLEPSLHTLCVAHTATTITILNRYPYNAGHLLIAPRDHIDALDGCSNELLGDLMVAIRQATMIAGDVLSPDGWNIGINIGTAAGAGLPGHLHIHVVPRWNGDSNFMATTADVRVISHGIDELWNRLIERFGKSE